MNLGNTRKIRVSVVLATLALYLVASALPAVEFVSGESMTSPMTGAMTLFFGWMGLFVGQLGWLANLPLLFGLVFLWRNKVGAATISALLALSLALHTFMLFGKELPRDEAGTATMALHSLQLGFYLWIGCMVTLLLGSIASHTVGRVRL